MNKKSTFLSQAAKHHRHSGLISHVKQSSVSLKWYIGQKYTSARCYANKHLVYPHMSFINPALNFGCLELTNACNLRCKMCTASDGREIGYMSKSLFQKCIHEFSELKCDNLYLHYGGESLLHPNFKEYLTCACEMRGKGIKTVGWVDNGTLFNKDIADLVISLGVDDLMFSIDGLGEVNDRIRIGSNYEKIRENIVYLLSNRRNSKPAVVINTTDYDKTEQETNDFLKVWTKLADSVYLVPTFNVDKSLNQSTYYDGYETKQEPYCTYPFNNMMVRWDGKVTGCCVNNNFNLGNANSESLTDIWRGKKFKLLRKQLVTGKFGPDSPCVKCDFWRTVFNPSSQELGDMSVYLEGYKKKFVSNTKLLKRSEETVIA